MKYLVTLILIKNMNAIKLFVLSLFFCSLYSCHTDCAYDLRIDYKFINKTSHKIILVNDSIHRINVHYIPRVDSDTLVSIDSGGTGLIIVDAITNEKKIVDIPTPTPHCFFYTSVYIDAKRVKLGGQYEADRDSPLNLDMYTSSVLGDRHVEYTYVFTDEGVAELLLTLQN